MLADGRAQCATPLNSAPNKIENYSLRAAQIPWKEKRICCAQKVYRSSAADRWANLPKKRCLTTVLLTQPEELRAAGIKIAFCRFDNSFASPRPNAANAVAQAGPAPRRAQGGHLYPAHLFGSTPTGTVETADRQPDRTNVDPLE